jgi:hypothetical protein
MDRAIHALINHCEVKYRTPFTVAAYYKALFADEAWESLRQSIPANGERLSEASVANDFRSCLRQRLLPFLVLWEGNRCHTDAGSLCVSSLAAWDGNPLA